MTGGKVSDKAPVTFWRSGKPCDNPRRSQRIQERRSVNRMTPYGRRFRLPEGVANDESPETEGERQLKLLSKQQLDTNLSLEEQFARHRSFQSSTSHVPIPVEFAGQLSASDFCNLESRKNKVDNLREMGLDKDDIIFKLAFDDLMNKVENRNRLGPDPNSIEQMRADIEARMETKKKELSKLNTFRDAKQLSRHEMDLEKSLKPTSHQTGLLRNLLMQKQPDVDQHPSCSLKGVEQQLIERVKKADRNKRKASKPKRRRQLKDDLYRDAAGDEADAGSKPKRELNAKVTGAKTKPVRQLNEKVTRASSKPEVRLDEKVSGASSKPERQLDEKVNTAMTALLMLASDLYTKNDPVVRTYVVPIADEDIKTNRFSLDEIHQIPRFKQYAPGVPSKVLYLKNLANDVLETDLIALFSRYQKNDENTLQYRLLNGKMKGQAFITFPDIDLASQALHFINGYNLKGKPIIIQYGHKEAAGD